MKSFIACFYAWIGWTLLDHDEDEFWYTLSCESDNFSWLGWVHDGWLIAMRDNHRKVFWYRLNQFTHRY